MVLDGQISGWVEQELCLSNHPGPHHIPIGTSCQGSNMLFQLGQARICGGYAMMDHLSRVPITKNTYAVWEALILLEYHEGWVHMAGGERRGMTRRRKKGERRRELYFVCSPYLYTPTHLRSIHPPPIHPHIHSAGDSSALILTCSSPVAEYKSRCRGPPDTVG